MKRGLSSREKIILGIFAMTLIVYGVYIFGYQGLRGHSQDLEGEILRLEARLRKQKEFIGKEADLAARYASTLEDLRQKESRERVMSSMVTEIESAARAADLPIEAMKPQSVKTEDWGSRFVIDMAVSGDFEKIMRFIYDLESRPREFRIDEFHLQKSSYQNNALRCQLLVSRIRVP